MDHNTPISLLALCRKFFGFKPGQSLTEFGEEFKAMSPEDKADLKKSFEAMGYTIKE